VSAPLQRALVAGGAGFLGSHLCERLLAQGWQVLCVDNFHTGDEENIAHLLGHPRFVLLRHDINEPLDVPADCIYNLACPASPVHYRKDPVYTLRTCVLGTLNLLELAERLRAPLLLASTSEVYGDPEVHPQCEDYRGRVNPIGPRACYDEGKRSAEALCMDFLRTRGVPVRIARIFNTYGPRMRPDDGRVVSNFIVQALAGRPLTIYGDGRQTRSFCYVDDLVRGLDALMSAPPGFAGPVNLGNPAEYTVRELAERIRDACGTGSPLAFHPLPEDDPVRRRPDIALARHALGWEPRVGIEEGLARTVAALRLRLETERTGNAACIRPVHDSEVRP